MATEAADNEPLGKTKSAPAATISLVSRAIERNEPLANGFAAAGISNWDCDFASGQVHLLPWLRRLFGIPHGGTATSAALAERYHPDDRERVMAATAAAVADPRCGAFRERFRVVGDDGAVVWLEARAAIYRGGDGSALRTLGVMLDVSDEMVREQELEAGRKRFEAALADTAITLFQQDLRLRYSWSHNSWFGHAPHEMLGKTDAELIGTATAAPLERLKRTVLQTVQAHRLEITLAGPDGDAAFDLHVEPLWDPRGPIVGITGAAVALSASPGKRHSRPTRASLEGRDLLFDGFALHDGPVAGRTTPASVGTTALRRKLEIIGPLSPAAIERLAALDIRHRLVPARTTLQEHAMPSGGDGGGGMVPLLLCNGWAVSSYMLPDGGRQIIDFHLPGDLLGWPGAPPPSAGTLVATLTECMICELDGVVLEEITHSTEPLAAAFRWSKAMSETVVQQHLVNLGRRTALARVAHLLLELGERLRLVGRADEAGFRCPLTQTDLGDALGLTSVHVSRTLKQLRETGCLTFRNGFVAFVERDRLIEIAGYDPSILEPLKRAAD
jgi:CRP-like cAMP-binding protein/PAS domain-containing protein